MEAFMKGNLVAAIRIDNDVFCFTLLIYYLKFLLFIFVKRC